jgi:hypothetical protein
MDKEVVLNPEKIKENVLVRLERYNDLNVLEHYSMFMGVAQLLEIALKGLLIRRYGYDEKKIEKYTLGRTKNELSECGLRSDYIKLLESFVKYRNYIAHELIINDVMLRAILGGDSGRLELKHLNAATYELEQLLFLYEWCEENNAWD